MNHVSSADYRLAEFFTEYEARTNQALADPPRVDIEATSKAFADCFVGANPKGVRCGENDAAFRDATRKGFDFYQSLGTKSMKIAALTTTPLDEYHAMVKVHWTAFYKKKDSSDETIDFDVIYLLQTTGDAPKVFAYITGDEEKVYKERGLLPE